MRDTALETLARLAVGRSKAITAVAVRTETGLALDPASFTFTRKPDADGRRVYDITGKNGKLDLTGTFTVDTDGAPHEVTLVLSFGTLITRRTGPA